MIEREDVRKIAEALGVKFISYRRFVSNKTLISDLRVLAHRFGQFDVVRRCNHFLVASNRGAMKRAG